MNFGAIGQEGLTAQEEARQRLRDTLLHDIKQSCTPGESTEFHHIIPREVWGESKVIKELGWLDRREMYDAPQNQMELPSTYLGAVASGLAMHSGSHPVYTAKVFERLDTIDKAYNTDHPGDKVWLEQQVRGLQGELRASLDRAHSMHIEQNYLNSSDPLMPLVAASKLVTEAKANAPGVEEAIAAFENDPRKGFPTNTLSNECPEVTVSAGQVQAIGQDLRSRAWAGVGQPGVPVAAMTTTEPPGLVERAQTAVSGAMKYAADHPVEIATGTVAVGLGLATLGAAIPFETGLAGSVAVGGGYLALQSNSAVAAPLQNDERKVDHLPPLSEMNSQSDIMGPRNAVDHIDWRFTGLPQGHAENTLAALHERDVAENRPGGAMTHTGAHYLLKADGSLVQSGEFSRPLKDNPQIAAGNNANAIGIYVEGKDQLTAAQRETLSTLTGELSTQWKATGLTTGAELVGAGYVEQKAWTSETQRPAPLMPVQRPGMNALAASP